MHPVRLTWLVPIVAGAVALWWVLTWPETAKVEESKGRLTTFVAADASGNAHDGVIQGPVSMGMPGHEDGSSAFSFAEPGSWVMVPSSSQLNAGSSDFLVSVWIKVEANTPGPGET